ncbi:MAG: hypothetical protein LUF35_12025 [Lachnospiraceae bacterium]|nr:hypothetical protein [Lachnospiraceae bacterium]
MEIKERDHCGLVMIASTRVYRRCNEAEILQALDRIFRHYTCYIDDRTLCCSLRDMMPDSIEVWGDNVPEDQMGLFADLREFQMEEYFRRKYKEMRLPHHWKDQMIGEAMSIQAISTESRREKGCFDDCGLFLQWLETHVRDKEPVGFQDCDPFPIEKEDLNAINVLCVSAARYSIFRMTYMRSAAADFTYSNIDLLEKETLEKILEVTECDNDYDWIKMKAECRKRLEGRSML